LSLIHEEVEVAWCAYLAGLLDGEGYIAVAGPWPPQPRIDVTMCELAAVQACHARYGGSLLFYDRSRELGQGNRRPVHQWVASGRGVIRPLRDALPHLRVKQEQARITLAVAGGMRDQGGWTLTQAEAEARRRAYHRCRELNRRGRNEAASAAGEEER